MGTSFLKLVFSYLLVTSFFFDSFSWGADLSLPKSKTPQSLSEKPKVKVENKKQKIKSKTPPLAYAQLHFLKGKKKKTEFFLKGIKKKVPIYTSSYLPESRSFAVELPIHLKENRKGVFFYKGSKGQLHPIQNKDEGSVLVLPLNKRRFNFEVIWIDRSGKEHDQVLRVEVSPDQWETLQEEIEERLGVNRHDLWVQTGVSYFSLTQSNVSGNQIGLAVDTGYRYFFIPETLWLGLNVQFGGLSFSKTLPQSGGILMARGQLRYLLPFGLKDWDFGITGEGYFLSTLFSDSSVGYSTFGMTIYPSVEWQVNSIHRLEAYLRLAPMANEITLSLESMEVGFGLSDYWKLKVGEGVKWGIFLSTLSLKGTTQNVTNVNAMLLAGYYW
ncbi:MAG: hypothetical protein CL678_05290 [Bdellovibrionaceae bacterium]|nr:hypothetical protein [Pseudobdellovibrionaceae bacterium]